MPRRAEDYRAAVRGVLFMRKRKDLRMLPVILAISDSDDRSYVQRVYEKYGRRLYKFAFSLLHNELDSEDCVHDVIVVLIDYLESYKTWNEGRRINFLIKCCRCIAINKYKKNKTDEQMIDPNISIENLRDSAEDVQGLIVSEESSRQILEMIEEMDPMYGDILYLRCFLHMSPSEIAERLGISKNLVNVRTHRARQILLKQRKEELDEIRNKR